MPASSASRVFWGIVVLLTIGYGYVFRANVAQPLGSRRSNTSVSTGLLTRGNATPPRLDGLALTRVRDLNPTNIALRMKINRSLGKTAVPQIVATPTHRANRPQTTQAQARFWQNLGRTFRNPRARKSAGAFVVFTIVSVLVVLGWASKFLAAFFGYVSRFFAYIISLLDK
jgi:hypothetical protein